MQEFGGFEIEFISNTNMKYTKRLVKEIIACIAESGGHVEINDSTNTKEFG